MASMKTDFQSLSQFDDRAFLGRGAFGEVRSMYHHESGKSYAVKCVNLTKLTKESRVKEDAEKLCKNVYEEAEILYRLSHFNIVKVFGSFTTKTAAADMLYIVMELCQKTLKQLIAETEGDVEERVVLGWMFQLLCALKFLHEVEHILHRDIKSENIMVTEDGTTLKIGDFGISKIAPSMSTLSATSGIGTYTHMAPEVALGEQQTWKSDTWSLGIVLFEACTKRIPFPLIGNGIATMLAITSGEIPVLPDRYSRGLRNLFSSKILVRDLNKRAMISELYSDHVFEMHVANLELRTEVFRCQKAITQYEQTFESFQHEMQLVSEKNKMLDASLQSASTRINDLNKTMLENNRNHQEALAKMDRLHASVEILKKEKLEGAKVIAATDSKNERLKADVQSAVSRSEKLAKTLESKENEMLQIRTEMERLLAVIESLEKENLLAERRMESSETELRIAKEANSESAKALAAKNNENRQALAENERLVAKIMLFESEKRSAEKYSPGSMMEFGFAQNRMSAERAVAEEYLDRDDTITADDSGETQLLEGVCQNESNERMLHLVNDLADLSPFTHDIVVEVLRERYLRETKKEREERLQRMQEKRGEGKVPDEEDRKLENRKLIYTYAGLFCVVLNPFCDLDIYEEEHMAMYRGKNRRDLPPHLFGEVDRAYSNMLQKKMNQSILCTGESGAGKTVNAKRIIQYLAARSISLRSDSTSDIGGILEKKLLLANPILEAFGNAKTSKNENSSRFGKFIRILFDGTEGRMTGAIIDTYMLEKSRVVDKTKLTRNFHIFYQLLKGCSDKERKHLSLGSSILDYKVLRSITSGACAFDNDWTKVRNAMKQIGITASEFSSVMKIVAACLHLGNVEFHIDNASKEKKLDQASIVDKQAMGHFCRLLRIENEVVIDEILKPTAIVSGTVVSRSQTPPQAQYSCNAIMKILYDKLFKWLVARLNQILGEPTSYMPNNSFNIGILDITGFEIFDTNDFEQLWINFTNERLQQLFNEKMLSFLQKDIPLEAITNEFDSTMGCEKTIELIGIVLSTLDDHCLMPRLTDADFVTNVVGRKHEKLSPRDPNSMSDFAIFHYAGKVEYTVSGWGSKNMEPINANLLEILGNSTDPLVRALFPKSSEKAVWGKRGFMKTFNQDQSKGLHELLQLLNKTGCHFIRCIIPNKDQLESGFEEELVLHQLQCCGVIQGVRVCHDSLFNAARFAKHDILEYLLESQPQWLEMRSQDRGRTPLLIAIEGSQLDTVLWLINRGADKLAVDYAGFNAAHIAAQCENADILQLFLDFYPAWIEKSVGKLRETPLLIAARANKLTNASLLVERGAFLNARNKFCDGVIHIAVQLGHAEMAEYLLNLKPEFLNIFGRNQTTPLMQACRANQKATVKVLLDRNAAWDVDQYSSVVHMVAKEGTRQILELLLQSDPQSLDKKEKKRQRTPLLCAAKSGNEATFALLLELKANQSATDVNGRNMLHIAAENGHANIVSQICKLRNFSKLVDQDDESGLKPRQLADQMLARNGIFDRIIRSINDTCANEQLNIIYGKRKLSPTKSSESK